ncbi:MAG: ABC transporter permease subunit [Alphaproteobacteria bacterium]|nr:ABC transporter permease subunit [Alphaproteobacteria bacterium]
MTAFLRSKRVHATILQCVFFAALVALFVFLGTTGQRNIEAQGMATGFGFLERSTGWPMAFSMIETSSRSTYAQVLWAGLLNTLLVGVLTLVFATLLGLVVAFLRVSTNLLARFAGTTFVEIFRNVPAILQVVFWYAVLTHTPRPRDAYTLGEVAFLSNRGLVLPAPVFSGTDLLTILAALLAAFGVLAAGRKLNLTRRGRILVVATVIALAVVLWLTGRVPDAPLVSVPELAGLRFVGGMTLSPEFLGLLVGLSLFGAAYVGEIIRGGLLSVEKGKLEAGAALGLSPWQVNRLIRIPLACRAMLPSLANQYIWLMKATTLGLVIGFSDFFAIVSTSINQSGQTLELIGILMAGFLLLNYALGTSMNLVNRRLKLKGGH